MASEFDQFPLANAPTGADSFDEFPLANTATAVAESPSVPSLSSTDINAPSMRLDEPLQFLAEPDFRSPFEAAQESFAIERETPDGFGRTRAVLGISGLGTQVRNDLDQPRLQADLQAIGKQLDTIDNPVEMLRAVEMDSSLKKSTLPQSRDIFRRSLESELIPQIKQIYGISDDNEAREKLYSDPTALEQGKNFLRTAPSKNVTYITNQFRGFLRGAGIRNWMAARDFIKDKYGISDDAEAEVKLNQLVREREAKMSGMSFGQRMMFGGKITDEEKMVDQAAFAIKANRDADALSVEIERIRKENPDDPRLTGTNLNSFLDGIAQTPANMLTIALPGLNVGANYVGLYDEAYEQALQVAKREGRTITREEAHKMATIAAAINTPIETAADYVLRGFMPKSLREKVGLLAKTRPGTAFMSKLIGKSLFEGGTELQQAVVTNVATGDRWNRNLSQNFTGGLGGGMTASVMVDTPDLLLGRQDTGTEAELNQQDGAVTSAAAPQAPATVQEEAQPTAQQSRDPDGDLGMEYIRQRMEEDAVRLPQLMAEIDEIAARQNQPQEQQAAPTPQPEPSAEASPAVRKALEDVQVENVDEIVANGGGKVRVTYQGNEVPFTDFAVAIDGTTAEVLKVQIGDRSETSRGIGTLAYIQLGQALAAQGITLHASNAQYADGRKLWDRLVAQGYAERTGVGQYRWKTQEATPAVSAPVAMVNPETGIVLDPDGPKRITEEGAVPLSPVEQASARSLGIDLTPANAVTQQQQVQAQESTPPPAPQQPGVQTDSQRQTATPNAEVGPTAESPVQPVAQPSMAPEVEVTPDITRDIDAFSDRVNEVAHSLPESSRYGPTKVWISDVYEAINYPGTLEEFKAQLARANQDMKVALSRLDFTPSNPALTAKMNASLTRDRGEEFRFVTLRDRRDALNRANRTAAGLPTTPEAGSTTTPQPEPPPVTPPLPPAPPETPSPSSPEGDVIGIRRSITDAERERTGIPEMPPQGVEDFQGILDEAQRIVAEDANVASDLVDALFQDPRPLANSRESGLLLHEMGVRRKELADASRAMEEATEETKERATIRFKNAQQKYQEMLDVAQAVGSERGRQLNSQKLMVNDRFELVTMLAEVRARDNNGEDLTEAQRQEITAAHERIQELEEQLRQKHAELQRAQDEAVMDKIQEEETAPKEKKKENKVLKALEEQAEAAKKRLRQKLGQLGSTVDPTIIADAAIIGASYLARGIRDVGSFTAQLVSEFGESIRQFAPQIFSAAQAEYQRVKAQIGKPTTDELMQEATPEGGLTQKLVSDLVRAHLRNGVRGFVPVIDAVVFSLQSKFPNVTAAEVRQVFSQYGKVTYPSQDEISTELRRLKTLSRLQEQLEDVLRRQAPKRTGYQRDKTDAEIRDLQKRIAAEMKALGIQATDPETQLASSLTAAKSRMQNEIAEIERAIETNQRRTANERTVQYDEEARQLQQQLAEARARYNEVFPREPISPEEQTARAIRVVERQIAEEEQMLREGILQRPARVSSTPVTPELENRRMELDALRQLRRELYAEQNPGRSPEQRAHDRALAAAQKALGRYKAMLESGNLTPQQRQRQAFPSSDELENVQMERDAMAELVREMRLAQRPKTSQEERTIKALEKSIAAMDQMLLTGNLTPQSSQRANRPETQRVAELREIRDEMARNLAAARRAARPGVSEDVKEQRRQERELKAMDKEIARLEAKIAANDFSSPSRRATRPEVQAVAERRAILDAIRDAYNNLRKAQSKPQMTEEEARIDRRKKDLNRRIEKLKERLANRDYAPRPKNAPIIEAEVQRLEQEHDKLKEQWDRERFENEMKHWTWGQKAWDVLQNLTGMQRAIKLGFDIGTLARQGMFHTLSHPILTFRRAVPAMLSAMRSEDNQRKVFAELHKLEGYKTGLWKRAGLAVTSPFDYKRGSTNEFFQSRWIRTLPKGSLLGPGLRVSERAYVTFLSVIRAYTFESLVATTNTNGTVTEDEAKDLANFVNATTGHGNLSGKTAQMLPAAGLVFLAPRYYVSRLQAATGHSFLWGTGRQWSGATRKMIAKEYARMLIGRGVYHSLWLTAIALAGDDEDDKRDGTEVNPLSTDFGKIKWGSARIDTMGGTGSFVTFVARMVAGRTKNQKGEVKRLYGDDLKYGSEDVDKVLGRFIESKRSLMAALVHDLMRREHFGGKPVTPFTLLEELFLPLSVADAYSNFRNHDPLQAAGLTAAAITGHGVTDYQPEHSIPYDILNYFGANLEVPKTDFERSRTKKLAPAKPKSYRPRRERYRPER